LAAHGVPVSQQEVPVSAEPADITPFNPAPHIRLISGKEYLEVKFRIQWFRSVNPHGKIELELVEHNFERQYAVFKATVTDEQGGVSSDYGSEEKSDFGDYIEKSATKALGRALGSLGYGTQFTSEHEFGADSGRVVDSPVERGEQRPSQQGPPQPIQRNASGAALATDRQVKFIKTLLVEQGKRPDEFDFAGMTMTDASALIENLKSST
jgi:hypothetical protein